jgi:GNAT superfamily N-acetyltransferase
MEDGVIELPEGLSSRYTTMDDIDGITALIAACEARDVGEIDIDRDDVEMGFDRSGFDAARDSLLVLRGGDRPVAWAEVYQNRAEACVRPSHRGRGIGSALLAWTEQGALEHGETKVSQNAADANEGAAALLRASGYGPTRTAWYLEIAFDDGPPPDPAPPEGISIRPYDPFCDERAVYRLIDDAFSEWEGRDPIPFEEWAPYVIGHNAFAPASSPLAFDGDELVGAVMSFGYAGTDEGWVQQLAAKRTHRHRGIARSLLHATFRAFYDEGKTRCGLSTDSRTGALTLYERVGMSVRRSYTRYTKPLG